MKVINTRKSLVTSIIAIIISFSILIGSTFAWFTDSASSGINKIQSGNLDVGLVYTNSYNGTPEEVHENTKIFMDINGDPILWEPGAFASGRFKVSNDGSLALKYELSIIQANATATPSGKTLADALTVYALTRNKLTGTDDVMGDANLEALQIDSAVPEYDPQNMPVFKDGLTLKGYLLPSEAITYEIGIFWEPTENDNEYNIPGGLSIDFAVALVATQVSYENDGDGSFYDENANFPVVPAIPEIVDSGSAGGVNWTLKDDGCLTVSRADTSVPDLNCGKMYEPGVWREAVVYDKNGNATKEGYNAPNASANEGGYFCDRNLVTSLVIEEGVTSIGSFAAQFPNLTGELIIPASVTYIGQGAFSSCPITKLTFAEGGTDKLCIAPGAFKRLDIEEIVFPADRPEIHIHCWALNDCLNLKHVTFPANVTTFSQWTHVDYCGMSFVNSGDSQILARCTALETITFGSQTVRDMFFSAAYNTSNINAIGNVQIIIEN